MSTPSRRATPRPAFVFVEQARQGSFAQMAAALRGRGFRTIHVTTARPLRVNRLISRLAYDRSIFVAPEELGGVAALLRNEDVRDVQVTEYVCEQLARGDAGKLPHGVGESLTQRADLLDKFVLGDLAARGGVRVPEKLAAVDHSPAQAVAELGLPLVVKAKVGASGLGVRIAVTIDDVEQAARELGPAEDLFYERFIHGEYVDYSAVAGPGGPVQEIVTRTVAAADTAPPSSIETVDDAALLEFGRHAVRVLGVTGFIHMDTVRDADGAYWLMDLNLRTWGSMISLRRAGIDFIDGYLAALGLSEQPPARREGDPAVVLTIFPSILDEQIRQGSTVGTLASYVRYAPPFVRMLGARYGASQLLASLVSLVAIKLTRWQARRQGVVTAS